MSQSSASSPTSPPQKLQLTPTERKASISLAQLFAVRMLGLFLLTPVFVVPAPALARGDAAAKVGLALGAYGLTQAILQSPLGGAPHRLGRRPGIRGGLALFVVGGLVCA